MTSIPRPHGNLSTVECTCNPRTEKAETGRYVEFPAH